MLPPSYAMTSGQPFAGAVPLGNVIVGAKLIDLPALVTVMLSVPFVPLFEKVLADALACPISSRIARWHTRLAEPLLHSGRIGVPNGMLEEADWLQIIIAWCHQD